MTTFKELISVHRAWYCLDCGKCSSVCPVTLHLVEGYTSPRLLVETALASGEETTLADPLLWSCLTCRRCSQICPSEVDFCGFVQSVRCLAADQGLSAPCTHGGMVRTWMEMMGEEDRQGDRRSWIAPDLALDRESDTLYFPGCLAYFDAAFHDLGFDGLEIARAAVRILNSLGIQPWVLDGERCCGHDLYWQGDLENFLKLAALNLEAISSSGAKRLLTTCPECAYTLKVTYPELVGDPGVEVFHLAEFLADQAEIPVQMADTGGERARVTFQDPCRLGRYLEIYQQPRDLLEGRGYQVQEMEHSRQQSACCGTSCWSSCGQTNKRIQVERLQEASSTGAEMLVTACPKCQIHLRCAQRSPVSEEGVEIPIRDLTALLADGL